MTLAAIRAEKAFTRLSAPDRKRLLAALSETARDIEQERQYDRYIDRPLRIRNRNALKAHLAPTLKILADDVGEWDATDWLTDCHLGNMSAAMLELKAFEKTAQRLLDGATAFKPDVRGELPLRTDLTRRAFYALIEVLQSVGVRVGATGGKSGGPGTRLLALLITHATGVEISFETLKDLIQQRKQRRSK